MRLSLTLTPDSSAPGRARTAVRAFSLGLDPAVLADAQLVLSEVVTSAVRRGGDAEVKVQLELLPDGTLRGEVSGAGTDGGSDHLGLRVVQELTSDWGVEPDASRLWFELGPAGV